MILITLIYLLIILLLLNHKPKPRKPVDRGRSPNRQHGSTQETENLLYTMCVGDRDLAHRLVASESADTEELRWKKAIYRLERDRS